MHLETRLVLTLSVLGTALFTAAPTRADSLAPMPLVERADTALARALPLVFKNGALETQSLPAFATAHHSVTLAELSFEVTKRIVVHGGFGLAEIVDAPVDIAMHHTGFAVGAGASYAIFQPTGYRFGVELSALHVRYGSIGFTNETMLLALTTR